MSETVFKTGDKVFCILNGHGVVVDIWDEDGADPVRIQFDKDEDGDDCGYTLDGRYYEHITPTLSFTEYTLSGFSQERPIELPEVGEEIMVSNSGKTWKMVKFIRHLPEMEYGFVGVDEDDDIEEYKYFKRLR